MVGGAGSRRLHLAGVPSVVERIRGLRDDRRLTQILADLGVTPDAWQRRGDDHVHGDLDGVPWQLILDGGLVSWVEATLAVRWLDDPSDDEATEAAEDDTFADFERVTAEVEMILGPPAFSDGAAAPGFPHDLDADWASTWPLPGWRLLVVPLHEDRELPFRVGILATPASAAAGEPLFD